MAGHSAFFGPLRETHWRTPAAAVLPTENPSLGAYGTLALHQVQRLRRKESCSKIILGIATDEETPPRCVIG